MEMKKIYRVRKAFLFARSFGNACEDDRANGVFRIDLHFLSDDGKGRTADQKAIVRPRTREGGVCGDLLFVGMLCLDEESLGVFNVEKEGGIGGLEKCADDSVGILRVQGSTDDAKGICRFLGYARYDEGDIGGLRIGFGEVLCEICVKRDACDAGDDNEDQDHVKKIEMRARSFLFGNWHNVFLSYVFRKLFCYHGGEIRDIRNGGKGGDLKIYGGTDEDLRIVDVVDTAQILFCVAADDDVNVVLVLVFRNGDDVAVIVLCRNIAVIARFLCIDSENFADDGARYGILYDNAPIKKGEGFLIYGGDADGEVHVSRQTGGLVCLHIGNDQICRRADDGEDDENDDDVNKIKARLFLFKVHDTLISRRKVIFFHGSPTADGRTGNAVGLPRLCERDGFLLRGACRSDVGKSKPEDHPEKEENAVIIPNVVRQPLHEEREDACVDAKADGLIGGIVCVFAKAQRALRIEEQKDKECNEREDARFHQDLQKQIMRMGSGFDARKRVAGVDHAERALADADALKSDIVEHTENAAPDVEAVGGGAVEDIGEAVKNDRIHGEIQNNAENGERKNSRSQKMLARNGKEEDQRKQKAEPCAA